MSLVCTWNAHFGPCNLACWRKHAKSQVLFFSGATYLPISVRLLKICGPQRAKHGPRSSTKLPRPKFSWGLNWHTKKVLYVYLSSSISRFNKCTLWEETCCHKHWGDFPRSSLSSALPGNQIVCLIKTQATQIWPYVKYMLCLTLSNPELVLPSNI